MGLQIERVAPPSVSLKLRLLDGTSRVVTAVANDEGICVIGATEPCTIEAALCIRPPGIVHVPHETKPMPRLEGTNMLRGDVVQVRVSTAIRFESE